MKRHVEIIAILSFVLLLCVLVGQAIWLIKIKEIKRNEFIEVVSLPLYQSIDDYLNSEMVDTDNYFSCGLDLDGKTFIYGKNSIQISSVKEFADMAKRVFYDHIYENGLLSLERIKTIYMKQLQKSGVEQIPIVEIYSMKGQLLMKTDSLTHPPHMISTRFIDVGYEKTHRLKAVFEEPQFFYMLGWHLFVAGVFFVGFCMVLWWLWNIMKVNLKIADVQTMGIAHLEHELKKPLMSLVAITEKMCTALQGVPDAREQEYMELVHGRLVRFQNVIESMLFALKTDRLEISRQTIDIRKEVIQVINVYEELKFDVKITYHIMEGCEQVFLDDVYFGHILGNLVDNGIKYNKNYPPEIDINFGREDSNWILKVADNGIGIPEEKIERIFKRFYRIRDERVSRKTGFGLGLTFVKKVVDIYKGEIKVENKKTGGSIFIVKLPMI